VAADGGSFRKITGGSHSLDALRGFDMFWITGGQKLVWALATVTGWPVFTWMNSQMHHVEWNGFAFYDMIFPLFLFLAGVSMPYSFASRAARGESRRKIYQHAVKRMIILVILGMLVNRILELNPDNMRFASVLGRIGVAWFLAAMIVLNAGIRWQVTWFWSLLIIYCLLMMLVPVPGIGAGVLTPEGNLAGYIDRLLLPGTMYTTFNEPEGILSTIPSVSTALLGVFAGHLLRLEKQGLTGLRKALIIIAPAWPACSSDCCGVPSSDKQDPVDQLLRVVRRRVEPDASGLVLPHHRCVEEKKMGLLLCGYRHELHYNLCAATQDTQV
jgi:predicted acyltransferase